VRGKNIMQITPCTMGKTEIKIITKAGFSPARYSFDTSIKVRN
jgi:hypothetical protein